MAKLTEQQARRVCEALGIHPDHIMPNVRRTGPGRYDYHHYNDAPAWEIARRAAEEESR